MSRLLRMPLSVLVLATTILFGAMPATALAVNTTLSVTKSSAPGGLSFTVADSHGQIDCGGDCTGSYPEVDCTVDPPIMCFTDTTTLTVTAMPPGTSPFWSGSAAGGCTNGVATCDVPAEGSVNVEVRDVQLPVASISMPGAGSRVGPSTPVTASASDAYGIQAVEFFVDGVLRGTDTFAPFQHSIVMALYADGSTHEVKARAIDNAGNVGALSAGVSYVIDKSFNVAFSSPPDALIASRTVQFAYIADSDVATASTTCRVHTDGSVGGNRPAAQCQSPTSITLTGTNHVVEFELRDDVGNSKLLSRTVEVDDAKPIVTITSPTAGARSSASDAAAFTVVDANPGTTRCSIDGAPLGACTSATTHSLGALADGDHTLTVDSTDAVGNHAVATRAFRVNDVPPVATITSGPADGATVVGTGFTFGIVGDATATAFQCRIWVAALSLPDWGACSLPDMHAAAGLPLGTYAFEVRATDADGLAGAAVRRTVTLVAATDATQPTPTQPTPTLQRMSRVVPAVRGRTVRGRYLVTFVQVARLPVGAAVRFTCTGGGCPRAGRVAVRSSVGTVVQLARRSLAPRTIIKVFITRAGYRPMTIIVRVGRAGAATVTVTR